MPLTAIFGASSSSNDALNRLENAFQLVYSEVGSERPKSMTFIAEDAQQKEVWMKNLSRCILAFKRREVQKVCAQGLCVALSLSLVVDGVGCRRS